MGNASAPGSRTNCDRGQCEHDGDRISVQNRSEPVGIASRIMTEPTFYSPTLGKPLKTVKPAGVRAAVTPAAGLLVRAPNWLGDNLMALPALYRLRSALPADARFTVLCREALVPLWETVPWVSEALGFRGRRVSGGAADQLRSRSFGAALILPNSFGSAWDVFRLGVPYRVGRRGRARGMLLTHELPELPRPAGTARVHQLAHWLELVSVFGDVAWSPDYPSLSIPADPRVADPANPGTPLLVVAPGAAYGPAKQWPVNAFRGVAERWCAQGGCVAAAGVAAERDACERLIAGLPEARNLAGSTDLRGLMALLAQARCVLCNDSGTMHLAAALGRRGVAVFGSTDPVATGPVGGRWAVVRHPRDCSPCFRRRCPFRDHGTCVCLEETRPEEVWQAVEWIAGS